MIRRFGSALDRFFSKTTPDPFVLAILLTIVTAVLALLLTDSTPRAVVEAWQGKRGFWGLLSFTMQMCLVLVTGHALASAPPIRRLIALLVRIPNSPGAAGALVSFVAIFTSFINWGLALIVGALLAREMGRAARSRGLSVHYPLLAAAGYTGLMTWHGGFSGSAPLKVTRSADLVELLGPELAGRVAAVPIEATVLSTLNLVVSGGLLLLVPLLIYFLTPTAEDARGIEAFSVAEDVDETPPPPATFPERLEQSPFVMLALGVPLVAAIGLYLSKNGISRLDPNAVNLFLLCAGLVLHKTPKNYANAVQNAVRGCAGIILQFPLYGGIMGMMGGTGLAKLFAAWAASSGSRVAYCVLTFFTAGLINFFVPSGGGQWAVQGPIAAEAALTLGVPFETAVMSVAYGDQWSNMLQPFWALPLLGITGVRAKDVIGYTATIMILSGVWFVLGLVLLG